MISTLIVSLQNGQGTVNGHLLRTHSTPAHASRGPFVPKTSTERPLSGALLPAAEKRAADTKDATSPLSPFTFPPLIEFRPLWKGFEKIDHLSFQMGKLGLRGGLAHPRHAATKRRKGIRMQVRLTVGGWFPPSG